MPKRKSTLTRRKSQNKTIKKRKHATPEADPDSNVDVTLNSQDMPDESKSLNTSSTPLAPEPDPDEKPTTPAARFIAVPELRHLLFRCLDTTTLAAFSRVKKDMLADVASVLYETVDYGRARGKMRRDTPRGRVYCDAVRKVTLADSYPSKTMRLDILRFDPSKYGQPTDLPLWERSILRAHHLLFPKFPNLRHIAWSEEDWVTFDALSPLTEDRQSGKVVGKAHCLHASEFDEIEDTIMFWRSFPPARPSPSLQGYERKVTSINLVVPYIPYGEPFDKLELPGHVRLIESLEVCGTIDYIAALFEFLSRLKTESPGTPIRDGHSRSDIYSVHDSPTTCFERLTDLTIALPFDDDQNHTSIADFPQMLEVIQKYFPNLITLRLGMRWMPMADQVMDWKPIPMSLRLRELVVSLDDYPDENDAEQGIMNVLLHFAAMLEPSKDPLADDYRCCEFSLYGSHLGRHIYKFRHFENIVDLFLRETHRGMRFEQLAKQDLGDMGVRRYTDIKRMVYRADGSALPYETLMARYLLEQLEELQRVGRISSLDEALKARTIEILHQIANDNLDKGRLAEQLSLLARLAVEDQGPSFPFDEEYDIDLDNDAEQESDDGESACDNLIETSELLDLELESKESDEAEEARQMAYEPHPYDTDESDRTHRVDPAFEAIMAYEALENYIEEGIVLAWRSDH